MEKKSNTKFFNIIDLVRKDTLCTLILETECKRELLFGPDFQHYDVMKHQ